MRVHLKVQPWTVGRSRGRKGADRSKGASEGCRKPLVGEQSLITNKQKVRGEGNCLGDQTEVSKRQSSPVAMHRNLTRFESHI